MHDLREIQRSLCRIECRLDIMDARLDLIEGRVSDADQEKISVATARLKKSRAALQSAIDSVT